MYGSKLSFLVIIFYTSLQAQSTFLRHDQLNSTGFTGNAFCHQKQNGNFLVVYGEKAGLTSTQLFLAEYNQSGDLIKKTVLPDQYTESSSNSVIFLNDGSFWTTGQYADFNRLGTATYHYDSLGNILHFFPLEGSFESLTKINDTLLGGIFVERTWDSTGVKRKYYSKIISNNGNHIFSIDSLFNPFYAAVDSIYFFKTIIDSKIILIKSSWDGSLSEKKEISINGLSQITYTDNGILVIDDKDKTITEGRIRLLNHDLKTIQWDTKSIFKDDQTVGFYARVINNNEKVSFPLSLKVNLILGNNKFEYTLGNLMSDGTISLLEINYFLKEDEYFFFNPSIKTKDNGYFGLAGHWNQPYQFNIMKTDSLGRVFHSDYLGGIIFTGIDSNYDKKNGELFMLYPNPTSTIIRIQPFKDINAYYRVINMQGEIIKQGVFSSPFIEFEVSNLSKGMYSVQVFDEENLDIKKFIVQ